MGLGIGAIVGVGYTNGQGSSTQVVDGHTLLRLLQKEKYMSHNVEFVFQELHASQIKVIL